MTASELTAALAQRLLNNAHSPGDIHRAARLLEQLAVIMAHAERQQ